jgi:polyisoprenoid-binding protein YceI
MNFKKLALLSTLLVSTLFAGNYNVDVSHSNMGFNVKHLMISNVKGNFNDFKGSFEYDEKTKTLVSLDGEIQVASINTDNEKRDKHLRAPDLFDAAKFPLITFKLTKVDGDDVYGDFTMKGVTKNIKLDFDNGGTIKDPWGNNRAGFTLSGKIDRTEFGITWNKILEAGGVTVGNEIKLDIEIQGIQTK